MDKKALELSEFLFMSVASDKIRCWFWICKCDRTFLSNF